MASVSLYKLLDVVADVFNPMLGLFAVAAAINCLVRQTARKGLTQLVALLVTVSIAYVFMFLKASNACPFVSSNYSTHTGVSAAILLNLAQLWHSRRAKLVLLSLAVLYALLMIFQGYHTAFHIVFSAGLLTVCWLFVWYLVLRVNDKDRLCSDRHL